MNSVKVNQDRNNLRDFLITASQQFEKTMDVNLFEIQMDEDKSINDKALILLVDKDDKAKYYAIRYEGIQFHSVYGHVVQSSKTIRTLGGIVQ